MDLQINTQEMRTIASNISSKKEEIAEIYKNQILPMLESSEECLAISGLSYDEVVSAFNTVFGSLDNQLDTLSQDLTNNVIPKYENSSMVINKMFNNEFASKMQDTLSIMKQE